MIMKCKENEIGWKSQLDENERREKDQFYYGNDAYNFS